MALSGLCALDIDVPELGRLVPIKALPRRFFTPVSHREAVLRFLQEFLDLLGADHAQMRDAARDQLGSDLSPLLYRQLFIHINTVLYHFFVGDGGPPSFQDHSTSFVEQAVSVLSLIFDRLNDSIIDVTDRSSDDVTSIVDNLLLSCVRYVHRLSGSRQSLRLKIKLAQLLEIILLKSDVIAIGRSAQFRNRLLEFLVHWTSDSQGVRSLLISWRSAGLRLPKRAFFFHAVFNVSSSLQAILITLVATAVKWTWLALRPWSLF